MLSADTISSLVRQQLENITDPALLESSPRTAGHAVPCRERLGLWEYWRELHLLDSAGTPAFQYGNRLLRARVRAVQPVGPCLLIGRTHEHWNGQRLVPNIGISHARKHGVGWRKSRELRSPMTQQGF